MSSVKKRAVRRRPLVVPLSCLAVPCLAWPRQAERCRASPCRASPSRAANSSKNKKGTCWQGIQTPGKSQDRAGHPKPACANFSLSPPEQKKFTLSENENQFPLSQIHPFPSNSSARMPNENSTHSANLRSVEFRGSNPESPSCDSALNCSSANNARLFVQPMDWLNRHTIAYAASGSSEYTALTDSIR